MTRIIFGWPRVIVTSTLVMTGICLRKRWPLLLATIVIQPSLFYFFGGKSWTRLVGIDGLLSLPISAYLVTQAITRSFPYLRFYISIVMRRENNADRETDNL